MTSRSLSSAQRRCWPTPGGDAGEEWLSDGEWRVAVLGDTESDAEAIRRRFAQVHRLAPDVHTVIQLGDLRYTEPVQNGAKTRSGSRMLLEQIDLACSSSAIDRVILVPGNHDWPEHLAERERLRPDRPYRLSRRVWAARRGERFTLAGVMCTALGGASSVGRSAMGSAWSSAEMISDEDMRRTAQHGPSTIAFFHEAINAGIPEVDAIIADQSEYTAVEYADSALSRARVTAVWERLEPMLAFHGHMHVAGETVVSRRGGDRRVYSLAQNNDRGGAGLLNLRDLRFDWLPDILLAPTRGGGR